MTINIEIIISVVLGITTLVGTFLSFYFQTKAKIEKAAVEAIDNAEVPDKTGEQKMGQAVDQVFNIVPAILKPFLSKKIIQKIIQKIFRSIEDYAKKQCEKK